MRLAIPYPRKPYGHKFLKLNLSLHAIQGGPAAGQLRHAVSSCPKLSWPSTIMRPNISLTFWMKVKTQDKNVHRPNFVVLHPATQSKCTNLTLSLPIVKSPLSKEAVKVDLFDSI